MADVLMPRLSDSMEEGTILGWLVAPGDTVSVGQEIVEIETDKANMGYEAAVAGTVSEIVAEEGDTLPIGALIARIGDGDEAPPPPSAEPSGTGAEPVSSASARRVKASPIARRMAKEEGLDLDSLAGSGPAGRIVKADVEGAIGSGTAGPGPVDSAPAPVPAVTETAKGETRTEELTRSQQVIARRMSESKATAPHFYLRAEIEMSAAVAARAALKESAADGDPVPSFNDMVVKACAIALRGYPKANASYRDGRFELHSRVNVGVAVATAGGLVVPTVFDADRKGLGEIATETRSLSARVREGAITPPELSGGTFSVSNLGMYGVDEFAAVINTPQAGILAVGAIREAPVVRDGAVAIGHPMNVTLSCDHRVLYGAEGAEFLARVRAILEQPIGLAL